MTSVFQSLLLVSAGATPEEVASQVKFLKVENQILRSRLPKRISVTVKERNHLVKFANNLGGNVLCQLTTIVASETILGGSGPRRNRSPFSLRLSKIRPAFGVVRFRLAHLIDRIPPDNVKLTFACGCPSKTT